MVGYLRWDRVGRERGGVEDGMTVAGYRVSHRAGLWRGAGPGGVTFSSGECGGGSGRGASCISPWGGVVAAYHAAAVAAAVWSAVCRVPPPGGRESSAARGTSRRTPDDTCHG